MRQVSTDVLIVGAGGAGMYAAISAARQGASVLLLDKSLVGRGGATIMAQMTVAGSRMAVSMPRPFPAYGRLAVRHHPGISSLSRSWNRCL